MHDYSVVISPYGVPGGISGAMAVVGPTRMHYSQTISTVRFIVGADERDARDLLRRGGRWHGVEADRAGATRLGTWTGSCSADLREQMTIRDRQRYGERYDN